jgi:hypothetical protein
MLRCGIAPDEEVSPPAAAESQKLLTVSVVVLIPAADLDPVLPAR